MPFFCWVRCVVARLAETATGGCSHSRAAALRSRYHFFTTRAPDAGYSNDCNGLGMERCASGRNVVMGHLGRLVLPREA